MRSLQVESRVARREKCPGCGHVMEPFFELLAVPTNSCVLLESADEARSYPRGDIVLGFCAGCGFICNLAFDEKLTEYSSRYEETQGYSPTFQKFHRDLAQDLVDRLHVHDKDVLEIGCGKGEFLAMLCEIGRNRGTGFDPGYDDSRDILSGVPDVRVIQDFYSSKYSGVQADLVCCKMTLEHIAETGDFARLSHQAMRPGADSVLYFLVPNASRILQDCAFEDIYYEHCSYFTAGSLARLFRSRGFSIERLGMEYGDQYLAIEGRLADDSMENLPLPEERDLDQVGELVSSFGSRCVSEIDDWKSKLSEAAARGSLVLWGSGSKAVAFLGAVDPGGLVDKVVDINPYRQGNYMPGSGQPIIAPSSLAQDPPGTVIIMNSIYQDEIGAELGMMGLNPTLWAL